MPSWAWAILPRWPYFRRLLTLAEILVLSPYSLTTRSNARNLDAIKMLNSGKLGELRYFNSIFSMQAREPNIRLAQDKGGGPLRDLGVYCINAARYLFRAEPTEALAMSASGRDKRFREVEEM